MNNNTSILERWGITEKELTELVDNNPSLRGIMLGYVAEKKFQDAYLEHPDVTEKTKDDDHDRQKKGDRRITYKGRTLIIEVKSLQTKMVKRVGSDQWNGKAQVDASDRRKVVFPDRTELETTLLLRGEFDLLAVNCFAFGEKWRFVFAKNSDLPCSSFRGYSESQRSQLIASLIPITWPPQPPFTDNLIPLLDELVTESKRDVVIAETKAVAVKPETVKKIKRKT